MPEPDSRPERAEWMSVLARADAGALATAFSALGPPPEFDWLRRPEVGAVMVQGRAGGTGAPFNLGEMTVTRCALKLADGRTGHAYVPGRDREKARIAALCDALMQGAEAGRVASAVLEPMRRAADERRAHRARKAAATKVDFFTMVRGEDK